MRYRFGECVLDTALYGLERQGQAVRLPRRGFQVLVYLLEQRHRVVARDELFAQIWGEHFVSDSALEGCIKQVRQAIGDSGRAQRLVKTHHGYGYRFVAPVMEEADAGPKTSETEALPPGADFPQASPEGLSEATPADAHLAILAVPSASEQAVAVPLLPNPERRQLTVLSCRLVEAAALAARLDPDDLHDVVQALHTWCAAIIQPLGGTVTQRTADSVAVYFGAPQAHDDDARRAVQAGLRLVETVRTQAWPGMLPEAGALTVRIGIHTGPVVLSPPAAEDAQPPLAVGATFMIAAGLRDQAAPQTLVISAATAALVQGYFTWQLLAPWIPPGHREPIATYRVTGETGARMRLDLVSPVRLTPFVGREPERALLQARWGQAQEGQGQGVVLCGEAGIGKSRLVRELALQLRGMDGPVLESRGSPYTQHTAFAPVHELVHQIVGWDPDATADDRVTRFEAWCHQYGLDAQTHLPVLAPLLDLPVPADRYAPLHLTPPQQRRRTLETLVALPVALAARQPVLLILEDVHWVDASTLEWLGLLLDQVPTSRILIVLTCRPAFQTPWPLRSYLIQVTLSRLTTQYSAQMAAHVARGALPGAVVEQVVARTDGVPLFIEELTRALLDARTGPGASTFPARQEGSPATAIPLTLQEALTARLDQVGEAKRTAQVGAVIGRQFRYALLRAVSPLEEPTLQQDLHRLVASELLHQRGVGIETAYRFKHALIQDAAYASLLRRTRQQVHRQIAQTLETQFPATKATQPELLAHHYTEAGLRQQAIPYWQQAGQRAYGRSAYAEAIAHLTKGLDVLLTLPESPARAHQELELQMSLGTPLIASKGWASPEAQRTYARALALCQQTETSQYLFPAVYGLGIFYFMGAAFQTAYELGEQCLRIARQAREPEFMLESHVILGSVLLQQGEFGRARTHLERGLHLYDPQRHQSHATQYGQDPGVVCHSVAALTLWLQGYPDQALAHIQSAYTLSQNLTHSMSRMFAMEYAGWLHLWRRAGQAAQQWTEPLMALASEQEASHILAVATFQHGWALTLQGESAGLPALRQGLAAYRQTGAEAGVTLFLAIVAEMTAQRGYCEEGLALLREAFGCAEQHGEHMWEAELYRCQGASLLLQDPQRHTVRDAEACFSQALDIARRQQAKSLELRAAVNLARLWHQQGKRQEASHLLAPVYGWFTEGFDTADVQEARALLDALR